ncbi:hypothetical protein [Ideonella sp. B508-1]|uniref:hypothetical protein n=1 Tax=Ideonella sp. B508-1 TaxID=137716 RepID=UPI00034CF404|nr:hypothetical protein [Ideonella sp. B508-1]
MDITMTQSDTSWRFSPISADASLAPAPTPPGQDDDPDGAQEASAPACPLSTALAQALQGTPQDGQAAFVNGLLGALSGDGSGGDGGRSLSGSLSLLITQVSQSNTPPDLQQAFDDWMANTQGQGQTPRLADVLASLQSQVGYGDDSGLSALNNLISTQA